ncbi:MAG: hypothetical protein K2H47_11525 [Muribaculaceae bacterium]|nr:hypothetical protein [Muribaculaceae bacterium]
MSIAPRHSGRLNPLRLLRSLLFCSILFIFHSSLSAYEPLPPQYDGSMMPYDFGRCTPAEVPDSLQPFFINYVARHGARFLSSEKKVKNLSEALDKARSAGTLTPLGEEMAALVAEVRRHTAGRWGALDSVGCAEQQRLAESMSTMWPSVTGNGTVQACATYVPRVVMSMYEFSHRLCSLNPDIQIYTGEGHQYDRLLRFFDANPVYATYLADKPWKTEYDDFVNSHVSPVPARVLVGDIYYNEADLRKLTLDIYGVLQSLRAAGLPAPTTRWISAEDYRTCWEAANLTHYYARSVNRFSCEPAIAAIPLLHDIINAADTAVRNESFGEIPLKASMWFGHAETLMPLLSLCDVEGCNAPDISTDKVATIWRDYDIVPLGANLEIVLLKAPSGTVYALTRLNGRDVRVGRFDSPLVPWTELRDYWTKRSTQMSL